MVGSANQGKALASSQVTTTGVVLVASAGVDRKHLDPGKSATAGFRDKVEGEDTSRTGDKGY